MEVNIKELFSLTLKRWWLILLFMILFGSISAIWTQYYVTPIYQAYTTVYVGKNADEQGLSTTDLYIGATLVLDYSEIAKSRLVASAVANELGLNMSPAALSSKISVSQKPETRVIQISVRDPNPELAMMIANKEAEVFMQKVAEIMQIENVQIIDTAELPLFPVSPNKQLNILIAVALGFVASVGIIILKEFLDDTVKTPEDIKRCVDLPVLGAIPAFQTKKRGA